MQLKTLVIHEDAEQAFVDGCVDAILQNDTSQTHTLKLVEDCFVYLKIPYSENNNWIASITNETCEDSTYICVFGKSMIEYLYHKSIQKASPHKDIRACVEAFLAGMKQSRYSL